MKPTLSIIILNYNTKKVTLQAIQSIEKNYYSEISTGLYEIIVADNASPDNSLEEFFKYKQHTKIKSFIVCDNKENVGFSKGNNLAIKKSNADSILILNPDTIIPPNTLSYLINFITQQPKAGAVSCKIIHQDGSLDPNCLRGFPTPWNSFCHFSGLGKLFPSSKFFNGYLQYRWRDLNKLQEVDAIEGAFMLIPKNVGDKVGWFDEDYFFYGEDLQLCLDIHNAGYKIYYVPDVAIMHLGGVSSGIKKQSQNISTADQEVKRRVQGYRFNAMRLFFQKNYANKYPKIISWLIFTVIDYLYVYKITKLSKN